MLHLLLFPSPHPLASTFYLLPSHFSFHLIFLSFPLPPLTYLYSKSCHMQTLLVPVDFSPASRNALAYAAELARTLEAKLVLFHAYMLPTPVSEVPYIMVTADEMQKENEVMIAKDAAFVKEAYGLDCQTVVRLGIASDETKVLQQEIQADLVVMGMKGAGGLEKIIGSTTTNVIRKLKVPVLIIPHDAAFAAPRSIVYSSDFSYSKSFHLFDSLLRIARYFQSVIHILHIHLHHTGDHGDREMGKKDIENLFNGITHDYVDVESVSVTQGVNDYLAKNPAQMLVMVAHKHSFFERIFSKNHTAAMAYETHIPLLVLQDKG